MTEMSAPMAGIRRKMWIGVGEMDTIKCAKMGVMEGKVAGDGRETATIGDIMTIETAEGATMNV